MRASCAALEPCRHASARQRVLEQRNVPLRRADEDRYIVERHAAASLLQDPARDLDRFATFAWRGEELDVAAWLAFRRLRRGEQITPQRDEIVVSLLLQNLGQKGDNDLVALRRYLFATSQPPEREPRGDVQLFSAPGEGREAIEIARRILQEARGGVAFDDMAVFVRAPQRYVALLEHALTRAACRLVQRGTRRPHPAGRAFVAILACACEKLSARRFAEYLSLAQVPQLDETQHVPDVVVPHDEMLPFPEPAGADDLPGDGEPRPADGADTDEEAVVPAR